VKFSCERCGKRYATAERPTPGRTYKLKCKACGHLIVVRVVAAEPDEADRAETVAPDGARLFATPRSPPEPVTPPALPPEAHPPEAEPPPAPRTPLPSFDATSDITMPPPSPDTGALTPPPGEAGYVDLFSDLGETGAPEAQEDAPLLAAPRASLPDGFGPGAGAPDPFGSPGEPPSERTPARVQAPLSAPKVPVIPKPPQQRSTVPLVVMGIGVLLLVGILAFVMLSSGPRASPGPPRAETAPLPAAERELTPPPTAEPSPKPVGAARQRDAAAAGKARRDTRERAAPPSTTSR
jgi:DNA-directed RNA polymerase subunit RPC12/RpoP